MVSKPLVTHTQAFSAFQTDMERQHEHAGEVNAEEFREA